ncbi:MAG: S8 family serine peptidase, partial [Acidiferrobacteraceae bacterium]|nr:S8 family serine peptidase [Acidiferrobacteraceae bacterium]
MGSFILAGGFGVNEDAYAGSSYKWNLSRIGVNKTLHKNAKKKGTNVKVGVLDSLTRCTHKELKGRCKNWVNKAGVYKYWGDHGTHVATTIAASNTGKGGMVGVAPKAYIHNYAVFDDYGWVGGNATETSAINHARRRGVRVINMSYGPSGSVMSLNTYQNIVQRRNQNITFVIASGNDGVRLRSMAVSVNAYQRMKNVILVGAVGRTKKLFPWSNRPGEGCAYLNGTCNPKNKYKYFTVVAPGGPIYAGLGNGGYGSAWGTSMAAPHVTGVVALLQGYWPVLKSRAGSVTNIIFHTAQDLGKKGVDPVYGWGLVRADRALGPLGKKYVGKNNKVYSLSASRLKVSPALSALTTQSVTFFDGYDRDFQMPLATLAPSYAGVL